MQSTFVGNVSKVVSGMFVGQLSVLVLSPVLTKLYTPEHFGLLGSFQSVVATLWVMGTLRYDLALSVVKTNKEMGALLSLILRTTLVFSIFILIVPWFIKAFFDVHLSGIEDYFWLVPLGSLLLGWFYTLSFLLIRRKNFTAVSFSKGVQGGAMSIGQLILGLIYPSPLMLILGYLSGFFFAIVTQIVKGFDSFGNFLKMFAQGKRQMVSVGCRYIRFPKYSVVSSFANIASTQIPTLLFAIVYSKEIAGYFFLAQRILGAPIDLLTNSISQVYLGEAGNLVHSNPRRMLRMFKKIALLMGLLSVIPLLVIYARGEEIFMFIFGDDWRTAGWMAGMLVLMYFARIISAPISYTLIVLEKLNIQLIWDVGRFVSLGVLFWLSGIVRVPIVRFVIYFSILMSLLYIIHGIASYYYLTQYVKHFGRKKSNG